MNPLEAFFRKVNQKKKTVLAPFTKKPVVKKKPKKEDKKKDLKVPVSNFLKGTAKKADQVYKTKFISPLPGVKYSPEQNMNFLRGQAQSLLRFGPQVGTEIINKALEQPKTNDPRFKTPIKTFDKYKGKKLDYYRPTTRLEKELFGDKPVAPLSRDIQTVSENLQRPGIGKHRVKGLEKDKADKLAAGIGAGYVALNLTTGGKGKSGISAVKKLASETDKVEDFIKIVSKNEDLLKAAKEIIKDTSNTAESIADIWSNNRFGRNLQKSGKAKDELVQVSERQMKLKGEPNFKEEFKEGVDVNKPAGFKVNDIIGNLKKQGRGIKTAWDESMEAKNKNPEGGFIKLDEFGKKKPKDVKAGLYDTPEKFIKNASTNEKAQMHGKLWGKDNSNISLSKLLDEVQKELDAGKTPSNFNTLLDQALNDYGLLYDKSKIFDRLPNGRFIINPEKVDTAITSQLKSYVGKGGNNELLVRGRQPFTAEQLQNFQSRVAQQPKGDITDLIQSTKGRQGSKVEQPQLERQGVSSIQNAQSNLPTGSVDKSVPVPPGVQQQKTLLQKFQTGLGRKAETPSKSGSNLDASQGISSDSNIPQGSDPVKKIIDAIKGAKPLTKEQKKLYSQERSRRIGQATAIGQNTSGEQGFFKQLGALKGQLPKADFEAVRPKLEQADVDELFNRIKGANITEFEKISAGDELVKLLGPTGSKVPTPSGLRLLEKVYGKEFVDAVKGKRGLGEKGLEMLGKAVNLPRSLMSTFDLSAPLRQGVFLVGKPKQFFPAFARMFKYFGSEKAFKGLNESIQQSPNYLKMRQGKLYFADMNDELLGREEAFLSNWAEKIPGVGIGVRASGRAYAGFLNKLRADVFDDLIRKAESQGIDTADEEFLKSLGSFINTATGRGGLGKFEKAAPFLNGIFFSPRLMSSRMNLLNPYFYAKQDPFVRKQAVKSLFTFAGTAVSILALADMVPGVEVGKDPRSADFGKIKIGNTRYDIGGGFQQYLRLAGQLITGELVSSTSGKLTRLGDTEEYKPLTRLDIIQRFFESKEAPVVSLITALLRGSNQLGEPLNLIPKEASVKELLNNEIAQRFMPMFVGDLYELMQEQGPLKGALGITPAIFGVGVQTYGGTKLISSPEQAEGRGSVMLYKYLRDEADPEEANKFYQHLLEDSPQKAERLEKFREIEEAGLTEKEMQMVGTGVKDGERAELITAELNKLKTKEEKNAYINKLYDLKIMSDDVYDQLAELKKKGKLKSPEDTKQSRLLDSDEARITQEFGNYNPAVEIFSKGVNSGTDIAAKEGTRLRIPDGEWEVIESYDGNGMNSGYGKSVMVKNTETGEEIRLSHLQDALADEGEILGKGTLLGTTGMTGNTTGPHIDIEYYNENGELADILESQWAKYI